MSHNLLATACVFAVAAALAAAPVSAEGLDLSPTVVTADLWDAERIATCAECGRARVERLARINLTGRAEPRVECAACGER